MVEVPAGVAVVVPAGVVVEEASSCGPEMEAYQAAGAASVVVGPWVALVAVRVPALEVVPGLAVQEAAVEEAAVACQARPGADLLAYHAVWVPLVALVALAAQADLVLEGEAAVRLAGEGEALAAAAVAAVVAAAAASPLVSRP